MLATNIINCILQFLFKFISSEFFIFNSDGSRFCKTIRFGARFSSNIEEFNFEQQLLQNFVCFPSWSSWKVGKCSLREQKTWQEIWKLLFHKLLSAELIFHCSLRLLKILQVMSFILDLLRTKPCTRCLCCNFSYIKSYCPGSREASCPMSGKKF